MAGIRTVDLASFKTIEVSSDGHRTLAYPVDCEGRKADIEFGQEATTLLIKGIQRRFHQLSTDPRARPRIYRDLCDELMSHGYNYTVGRIRRKWNNLLRKYKRIKKDQNPVKPQWEYLQVVDQSDCGSSVGNTKITDLVFADDAVIFAESLEVLVMALEALHEEAKPLGLEVSWLKTKVQVLGDLLDEAVQSVHACGEDIEILESFTYLGSAVHNDGGSRQEVLQRIGIAHGVMDSLSGSIWRCRYLCRRTKIRIFKSLVIPVLLYGCETWTLNSDLKRRINAFVHAASPFTLFHRPWWHRLDFYSDTCDDLRIMPPPGALRRTHSQR
ncbi:putative uncharacterized transposon-derived protein F52C9.6 [Chionoecetes opilio]|uniref:Uncharacterized transposon-derived protein F52C9.6 n=1 Tax=Chionoecetes opilio TaxID=41210 RepID=A0A8J5CSB2_CHIOP|nr:putative uncharacterized transposon-derived protein F52C9.6 [Chionoecetes opilio]